ncbi:MAG: adenosylcobinamide kinase / adenosylcobinamide-phosphate guanylyltransferase [Micromonosporaceae bacterium]|jgi:adenosylcobinamide kinase/adenosylcobinamide-phosphate guanylyltransferase|nr:adenosylcobinamide kinase / adenosylcobinamide-phosphate guanylyltransferase [Micromonosporaceae bacterium]
MPERTLIVGGARSGKSRLAENLVAAAPLVSYVAPGYLPGDDADWAARVAAHQARRPATWRTIETTDVADVLAGADEHAVILIDCLGTWLTRALDAAGAWSQADGWQDRLDAETDRLVAVWAACPATVVAVSNEVGLGVVPATPASRLFRDLLGRLNQQIGTSADRLYLVVAGRALDLSAAIAI